ncbi:SPOR domain-containing protein [Paenibacillus montanisoli]|uniref:SPOR domain-containing protein n=1 Tax=Paenibacillus montanisoli TaxID=2081970 RepID=A0A328U5M0_9BACL|nr:SPOR domain-containing protein [Paenibacillus montanisoli]RAP77859.1 hypothetical protein DL346_05225 [Paenibacillus montanisoli]
MSTKGRITYRFDKQSGARLEPKQEEKKVTEVVPYFQEELKFTSEIGSWNSPFQNDAYALEQLIREADGQFAKGAKDQIPSKPTKQAASQTYPEVDAMDQFPDQPEQPDTILLGDEYEYEAPPKRVQAGPKVIDMYPILDAEEEEHDLRKRMGSAPHTSFGSYMSGAGRRPSKGPSWFKVFASVTGAIATGALFGYFVLALFTSNGPANSDSTSNQPGTTVSGTIADGSDSGKNATASNDAAAGQTDEGKDGAAANGGKADDDAAQAAMIQVNVPASSYYMLQYGVFSNKEGLDAAVDELGAKGLAAASLTSSDDYRVYVGMSADRDQAMLLGQLLDNMEVYVKQIDVPAVSAISFDGEASAVEAFFKQTSSLIEKLDQVTIDRLSAGSGSKGEDGEWKELHQQWITAASAMEAGLKDKVTKSNLQRLTQSINSAAVAAEEYAKKPSDAYLWSMQSSLMKAVFAEKAWFESLNAL